MRWYTPIPDGDSYNYLRLINKEDMPYYLEMRTQHYRYGLPHNSWRVLQVELVNNGTPCEFYSFIATSNLVLSDIAWSILQPLLTGAVESLPLYAPLTDTSYHLLKILHRIDCLDYSKATYESTTAEMINVESYVFHEEMIQDINIFYLPRSRDVVVSQKFKEIVESANLKGLIFEELC